MKGGGREVKEGSEGEEVWGEGRRREVRGGGEGKWREGGEG